MKKYRNSNKDIGLMSGSGICIDGDILLNCEHEHTTKSYLPLRMFIAFLATFSTAVLGRDFIGGETASTILLFHSVIATIAVSLFKSKFSIIKMCSAIISFIYVGILAANFNEVKYGFYLAVNKYLARSNISSGSWGVYLNGIDRSDYRYMFYFFMALILIVAIGASLAAVYRIDFPLLFIFTFPVFEIGMYQGLKASTLAEIGLLVSWITVLTMHIINHTTNKAGRKNTFAVHERSKTFFFTSQNAKAAFYPVFMSFVSLLTAGVFILIIIISTLFGYERPESFTAMRIKLHYALTDFDITRIDELLSDIEGGSDMFGVTTVGGTNGGILGSTNGISFNNVTALKITAPKFDYTMYLRGYVAGHYENNSWTAFTDKKEAESFTDNFDDYDIWPQDYDYELWGLKSDAGLGNKQNSIDVTVRSACKKFVYAPYGTKYTSEENLDDDKMTPIVDSYVKINSSKTKYSLDFYDLNDLGGTNSWTGKINTLEYSATSESESIQSGMDSYTGYVYDKYLDVTDSQPLREVYEDIVNTYLDGDPNGHDYVEIYRSIKNYFIDNNYEYDLTPGATPKGEDFIDYFLTEQKKGYCTYYATVGAQLLRMFGYPARYVEGYMVLSSQQNVTADDDGRYTISIPDKCAHAWSEVFIDGAGWVPAEFTPGYDDNNPNLTEQEKNPEIKTTTTTTTAQTSDSNAATESGKPNQTTTVGSGSSNSLNSDNSSGQVGKVTSVTSTGDGTESGAVTTKKVSAVGKNNGEKKEIPPFARALIITVVGIIILVATLILNRRHKLTQMHEKCTQEDAKARVIEIFRYTLKYLSLLDIHADSNLSDMQLCELLLEKCHEKHINDIDERLTDLCGTAVKAHMSDSDISEQEAEKAAETLDHIAHEVVEPKLSEIGKLSAKFVYCLY